MRPPDDEALLRPLAWSRIAVGTLFLLRTTPLAGVFERDLSQEFDVLLGWPDGQPHWTAWGVALPASAIKLLCLARTLGALCFAVGYRARLSGVLASVAGYLVLTQDAFGFTFTQHAMLLGTLVLALGDCDGLLALAPSAPQSPRSSLWLVRAMVASVYFWAALVKVRPDWLDGRALGLFYEGGQLRGPLADLLLGDPWRRALAAKVVVGTELLLVPLLLGPRRPWAGLAAALVFHGAIEVMARPDMLGWFMGALLLSFVPLEDASAAGSR